MPEFFHDRKLWRLQNNVLRYGELKKDIPHITHKMLTSQRREPEDKGMIQRIVYPVVPPKVEYAITPKGACAIPVIETIMKYGYELVKESGIEYPPRR